MMRHMACDAESDIVCALPRQNYTMEYCDCSYGAFPNSLNSSEAWVSPTIWNYLDGDSTTTRSKVDGLLVPVLLEVTRTQDGHLWKILLGPVR